MPSDRVTLDVKGTVPLDLYATAISGFSGLVQALTKEVAGSAKIDWIVEELSGGSACATIIGLSLEPASVERVVEAYGKVGSAVQAGQPIPFSETVKRETSKITGILNGKVSAILFGALEETYMITSDEHLHDEGRKLTTALGAVEGTIHTLSGKDGLKFTLYDALFGRAVTCYFSTDAKERGRQEELMRNCWEKRAIVQGLVTRDSTTDRPLEIRKISEVIPVISGDYRAARGALAHLKNDELPEVTIRRARDA